MGPTSPAPLLLLLLPSAAFCCLLPPSSAFCCLLLPSAAVCCRVLQPLSWSIGSRLGGGPTSGTAWPRAPRCGGLGVATGCRYAHAASVHSCACIWLQRTYEQAEQWAATRLPAALQSVADRAAAGRHPAVEDKVLEKLNQPGRGFCEGRRGRRLPAGGQYGIWGRGSAETSCGAAVRLAPAGVQVPRPLAASWPRC